MKLIARKFMSFVFILAIIASIGIGAIACGNTGTTGGIVSQQIVLLPNTALVVASDAPATDRVMAARAQQYYGSRIQICNGSDDDVKINAALSALVGLPCGNGKLILSAGSFSINDPIVMPDNYITIQGEGFSTLIDAEGLSDNESAFKIDNLFYCIVEDMLIEIPSAGNVSRNCISITNQADYTCIRNVLIDMAESDGIYIDGTMTGIYIKDNIFSGIEGYGINCLADISDSQITGNYFSYNTLGGVNIASSGAVNNTITNNVFQSCDIGVNNNGTNTIIRDNAGWVTENSGTATVLNGSTSIEVSHGLATTPTQVIVSPSSNPTNNVSFWYVDGINASSFTIRVNADPGAGNLSFAWRAAAGAGN